MAISEKLIGKQITVETLEGPEIGILKEVNAMYIVFADGRRISKSIVISVI